MKCKNYKKNYLKLKGKDHDVIRRRKLFFIIYINIRF